MAKPLELAGQKFGRLTAIRRSHQDKFQAWMWECRCDCGRIITTRGSSLTSGKSRSCQSCATTNAQTTHGESRTPLYYRWRAMLERTGNPNHREYANYGGRGITVCERWRSYETFATDMGSGFRQDLQIDRIDTNGHYEPSNCRWVSHRDNQRNKRTNHEVTWQGHTLIIQEWAELLGIKPNTIVHRLRRGWTVTRALSKGADPDVLLAIARGETP